MRSIAFSGSPLDRASYRRTDPSWLARQHGQGLFLPFWQNRPFVAGGRAGFLAWQPQWENRLCVFLGLDGSQPLFALDVPGAGEPELEGGSFQEMRAAAFVLPAADTAIAGQAKALLDWHQRHRFCPNCGHPSVLVDGGYRRICRQCGQEHFPRTDPVVIMLPIWGDQCLIGHNKRFPPLLFSAFAGFVEPGESMEEAVRRELLEEVDLKVAEVHYHATQPWPFPSSLMLGCYAQALSRDFRIDGQEIEAARWVSKIDIRARLADQIQDDLKLPASIAIAYHLIRDWACL